MKLPLKPPVMGGILYIFRALACFAASLVHAPGRLKVLQHKPIQRIFVTVVTYINIYQINIC